MLVGLVGIPYGMLSFYFETKAIRTIVHAQGNLRERVKNSSLRNILLMDFLGFHLASQNKSIM